MCNLGKVRCKFVIPADKPMEGFRWFCLSGEYGLLPLYEYGTDRLLWNKSTIQAGSSPTYPAWDNPQMSDYAGLHIFSSKELALADRPPKKTDFWGRETVLGQVSFWGQAVEHDYGYRAEFAQILTINYSLLQGRLLKQARQYVQNPNIRYQLRLFRY